MKVKKCNPKLSCTCHKKVALTTLGAMCRHLTRETRKRFLDEVPRSSLPAKLGALVEWSGEVMMPEMEHQRTLKKTDKTIAKISAFIFLRPAMNPSTRVMFYWYHASADNRCEGYLPDENATVIGDDFRLRMLRRFATFSEDVKAMHP